MQHYLLLRWWDRTHKYWILTFTPVHLQIFTKMKVKGQRVVNTQESRETKNRWEKYIQFEKIEMEWTGDGCISDKSQKKFPKGETIGLNIELVKYNLGIATATVEAKW